MGPPSQPSPFYPYVEGRGSLVVQPPLGLVLMTRYGSSIVLGFKQGVASGIKADSASTALCRTRVIQHVVPHVPPLLRPFSILIVEHNELHDVEVWNSM